MEARLEPVINSCVIMQWYVGWRKLCSFTNSSSKEGKFSFGLLMIIFLFNPVQGFILKNWLSIFFTTFIMPQVDFDVKYSDADAIIGILFCNSPKFTETFTKDRLDCTGTLHFPLRHTMISVCNNKSILDERAWIWRNKSHCNSAWL